MDVFSDFVKIMELENGFGLKVNLAKCEIEGIDSVNEEAVLEKFSKVVDQIKLIQRLS